MGGPANIGYVTSTGAVTADTAFVLSVVLTAGSGEAADLALNPGGSGGATVFALTAAMGTSVSADLHGAMFEGGLYASLSGSDASASIVYV